MSSYLSLKFSKRLDKGDTTMETIFGLGKERISVLSFFIYALNKFMENFQGQDGFVWFTGVVEDRNDPTKLGRVRVRCVGYHTDDKVKIPE